MRGPLILSFCLHLAVILIAWVGLPSFSPRVVETTPVVEVAVVTDIETKAPAKMPAPEPPKPKPAPKKAPEPPPKPPKPPEPVALPKPPAPPPPPPDAVALPKPKVPEPKPEPEPEPLPKVEPKPEPVVKPKPKPEPPKPKPEPEPKKVAKAEPKLPPRPRKKPKPPPEDEFASVLKTVEKLKNRPKPKKPEKSFDEEISDVLKKHEDTKPKPQSQQVSRLGQRLSMSEIDALKRQIEECWSPPAGSPEAEDLVVEVRLVINPDGQVRQAQIVDTSRMFKDPFYRAAAESVLRAIKHPMCTPLKLPQDKYDLWKETKITFNPRELVGR